MAACLLKPQIDLAALILRLGLAAIFIVHGYIKLQVNGPLIPEISQVDQKMVGVAELTCGILLVGGLLSRLAALVLIGLQVSAILMVSGKHTLEVLQMTKHAGADYMQVGPEYNLVLIAMCLAVFLLGSGRVSLDHLLVSRWRRGKEPGAT